MIIPALIVLSQTSTPKAILDRYAAYRLENPNIQVRWKASVGNHELGHGQLLLDHSKRLRFSATSGSNSYELSETELGGLELAARAEVYDQFAAQTHVVLPSSRISGQNQLVPPALLSMNVYSPRAKYTVETPILVGRTPSEGVSWIVQTQTESLKYSIYVDRAGKISRISKAVVGSAGPMAKAGVRRISQSPGTEEALVWDISDYTPIPHADLSVFALKIPRGYVPYELPPVFDSTSLAVDAPFPSAAWSEGGKMLNLPSQLAGKASLLLITSPESGPSRDAIAAIRENRSSLGGIPVKLLSLAQRAADANGIAFDSTGKASAVLGETPTPIFVLIDGKGKVTNLWSGFDRSGESEFFKEIQSAIKSISNP